MWLIVYLATFKQKPKFRPDRDSTADANDGNIENPNDSDRKCSFGLNVWLCDQTEA